MGSSPASEESKNLLALRVTSWVMDYIYRSLDALW